MTGRILIVDPVATNRIVLRVKLAAAFYDVDQAESAADALARIAVARPDLIIASDGLPGGAALDLCRLIRATPALDDVPVVLIQSAPSAEQRREGLRAGADDLVTRPLDDLVLLARLRSLLRARNNDSELRLRDDTQRALGLAEEPQAFVRPARVALVAATNGPTMQPTLAALRAALPDRITLTTAREVMLERAAAPDVFVISEAQNDSREGLDLLAELRARAKTRHCAILYHAGTWQRRAAATALDLGANDLMIGPLDPQELALRLQKQIARKRTAERLRANMQKGVRAALHDPLTGLFNRRYAMPHLARLTETAVQKGRPLAVMIADLDHFKSVNDSYGHAAGDAVLIAVAKRLGANLRPVDLIARHGGEEFLIVLPNTDQDLALNTALRLCKRIADDPFVLPGHAVPLHLTISIGVAVGGTRAPDLAPPELLELADRALFAAKAEGRNQALLDHPSAA